MGRPFRVLEARSKNLHRPQRFLSNIHVAVVGEFLQVGHRIGAAAATQNLREGDLLVRGPILQRRVQRSANLRLARQFNQLGLRYAAERLRIQGVHQVL